MTRTAPLRRAELTFVELDGEAVVYDEERGSLHHLNPSATIVWSLCDGSMTGEEMATLIAESFRLEIEPVVAQVRDALETFASSGLLEGIDAAEEPARG